MPAGSRAYPAAVGALAGEVPAEKGAAGEKRLQPAKPQLLTARPCRAVRGNNGSAAQMPPHGLPHPQPHNLSPTAA